MTVAQIKEKLKSRKLPMGGTKSDLIYRLLESIMAEEKLLDEGPGGESIDLSNVNMDEVLGLDDEKETNSVGSAADQASDGKLNESLLSLGSTMSTGGTEKPSEISKPSPTIKNPVITSDVSKAKPHTSATETKDQQNSAEAQISENNKQFDEGRKIPVVLDKKVQLKTAARLGVPLSEGDAKAKRNARFGSDGSPSSGGETKQEDAKAKRAARFGLGQTPDTAATEETAKKPTATEEDGKMLKRAERFGLPLKRGAADSSNSPTVGEKPTDEMLKKRAKRFGISGPAETDSKKEARAKRFGVA